MAEFTYNNAINASTSYTPFQFNYGYHFQASYKKEVNPCSLLKVVDKLVTELRKLMTICKENLQYA